MGEATIQRWHDVVNRVEGADLADILAEDAVFHSPVVHTPQEGKLKTMLYLQAASEAFKDSNFRYVREVVTPENAVLEFTAEIDGITINGVDMMRFDADGKIKDFKVMVRPLKAINMIHGKMRELLEQAMQGKRPVA